MGLHLNDADTPAPGPRLKVDVQYATTMAQLRHLQTERVQIQGLLETTKKILTGSMPRVVFENVGESLKQAVQGQEAKEIIHRQVKVLEERLIANTATFARYGVQPET